MTNFEGISQKLKFHQTFDSNNWNFFCNSCRDCNILQLLCWKKQPKQAQEFLFSIVSVTLHRNTYSSISTTIFQFVLLRSFWTSLSLFCVIFKHGLATIMIIIIIVVSRSEIITVPFCVKIFKKLVYVPILTVKSIKIRVLKWL